MSLTVITPPAELPVSLLAAKAYLQIGHEGEDAFVGELLGSATAQLERASGLALVVRRLKRVLTAWPNTVRARGFILRPLPVSGLVAVDVVDEQGVSEPVTSRFQLVAGRLALRPWSVAPPVPPGGRIEITFDAGFGAAADVPEDLTLAIRMLALDAYRRGANTPNGAALPEAVAEIVAAHREQRI